MKDHPYMPLFWGDMLKQTAFWSGEERALLIVLWATQWWNGPLPHDLTQLAKGIDYDLETFQRLWNGRVHALFTRTAQGYIHEDLEERRRSVAQISGARRSAGKASGEARRARAQRANPAASSEQTSAALLEQNREHAVQAKGRTNGATYVRTPIQSNPIQSTPDQEPQLSESGSPNGEGITPSPPSGADPPPLASADTGSGNGRAAPRRRRMPADHPTEPLRAWAEEHAPNVNFDAEIAQLRDHEFRDPHSDWDAVVRNWLRRAQKDTSRRGSEQLTRFERHKRRLYGAS